MDITRYNFEEEFENIQKVIEEASFLAIDGEFTGLSTESVSRICPFDTPAERFKKQRDGASDFLLIQFGLCAFKAIESEKRYEATPYNFYIFPRPNNHQSPDRRFLCQTSSIDFLISHDFDFNKLFKEGIPYLTHDQEVKLKTNLEQRMTDRNNSSFNSILGSPDGTQGTKKAVTIPKEYEEYIKQIRDKIDAYLSSEEKEPLAFPPCNAFQRKLIYQSIKQDYPLVNLETKTAGKKERFIVVTKCGDENEAREREMKKQNAERMKLDVQVGFSKVMRLITESGKLVVGHNMYLDVIHSVNHFYAPVPEELEDFKEMIPTIFPRLLDTKLMANTNPLKEYFMGTSLEELQHAMKLPPFKAAQVDFPEGFTKYSGEAGVFHEAGYDALITGSCFASMINFLGRFEAPTSNFLLPTHRAVQPFVNKLFMMRIMDIPYVDLSKPDVEPNRDHVFHVSFPKEWKTDDLYQLFEPYGNIQISWLTSTTAYVGLHKKDKAKLASSALCHGIGPFHVTSYSSHKLMTQLKSPGPCPHSANASASSTTPSSQSSAAGIKRRSPPSDVVYPPLKVPRKSLTKETIPYPAIPEEDEKVEDEETTCLDNAPMEEDGKEKGVTPPSLSDEEEDVGVPVSSGDFKVKRNKSQEHKVAKVSVKGSTSNGKLFVESDVW